MENQLQKTNTHQLPIVLSEKERQFASVIYHVNQITAYPLSAIQIEDWAKSINELAPDTTLEELKNVIVGLKLGRLEWDYHCGIQNIFKNLSSIPKEIYIAPKRKFVS